MILDAIIISDTHLGSDLCHANQLLDLLYKIRHDEIETDLLILNGDVFDSHDFRRLKKSHWKILSTIRRISDHVRVVWVIGNHDGPVDILSHLLGVEAVEEFHLSTGDKMYLVTHGDKFDEIMSKHPILADWADRIYRLITRWFPKGVSRLIKKSSKTYSRAINTVRARALAEGKKRGFDGTISGHTHHPEITEVENSIYANSGSWTETPTYLSVKDGVIELHKYN
jgi:UDP-2,3-diacylglucosamine pyrophosphatase LpxH